MTERYELASQTYRQEIGDGWIDTGTYKWQTSGVFNTIEALVSAINVGTSSMFNREWFVRTVNDYPAIDKEGICGEWKSIGRRQANKNEWIR
jgi:hypothetical protein